MIIWQSAIISNKDSYSSGGVRYKSVHRCPEYANNFATSTSGFLLFCSSLPITSLRPFLTASRCWTGTHSNKLSSSFTQPSAPPMLAQPASQRMQRSSRAWLQSAGRTCVRGSHTHTVLSSEQDTMRLPSGENATDLTMPEWPRRGSPTASPV